MALPWGHFFYSTGVVTLEANKLFCQLSPTELSALSRIAREKRFSAGQEIFKEGDNGDGVYVVRDGLVEISGLVDQQVRLVFSEVGPGDIFGEMAVIENKPRSACAVARTEATVYFIPRAEMLALVERSPSLALALLQEISHRLREFNRQYLREVLQTERLSIVGRFARSIVHDLKNPLNIIGLTAEMASMDRATPEMRQQATGRIRKQVERISDMIGEILDFTQGSHSDFILAPSDYRAFVNQLLEELGSEAGLKSVTLEMENPPPSVEMFIHPKRLRRVFYNLVHNATDAMPEGGKIILRFHATDTEVVTEIEDGGRGIAPEIAGQLFEVFATHGKAHGTGLGLSICKRIIEDHHGWISARNQPGRGAAFSFGLPRRGREKQVT
jgi:signal transduction histidine kinase